MKNSTRGHVVAMTEWYCLIYQETNSSKSQGEGWGGGVDNAFLIIEIKSENFRTGLKIYYSKVWKLHW